MMMKMKVPTIPLSEEMKLEITRTHQEFKEMMITVRKMRVRTLLKKLSRKTFKVILLELNL